MRQRGSVQSNVKVAVGTRLGTFTSFSVGMDESEVPFFEVKSAGQVEVGENGIQQVPRYLDAVGHNATTASSILAGTSLVKVSVLEKDGGVQLPVASVGMAITIVKASTNASGLDNFRIYPDNMASINGQAIGVHLDVSSTTKVVTCIAFDMSSWICTKQHANGGGSEGGKLESTTIGIESPASSLFNSDGGR